MINHISSVRVELYRMMERLLQWMVQSVEEDCVSEVPYNTNMILESHLVMVVFVMIVSS